MIYRRENLFAFLIIYLMRIASIKCQEPLPEAEDTNDENLRPIRKFSSFFEGSVNYQCVQTCYPNHPSQPQIMVELCNKICPFKPSTPECAKCPQIYSLTAPPTPGDFSKKSMITQPEAIVVEPETHAIMFTPEIVVAGYERKQCCYLDKCKTVPLEAKCDPICYEPCDVACTGRCYVNPQCPHECDRIRKQQFKLKYRIWLAGKLNEIKQKYREMATACLLRTRLAFVGEVQNYYQVATSQLGDMQVVLGDEGTTTSIKGNDIEGGELQNDEVTEENSDEITQ